jgi:hypothetical protein
MLQCYNASMLQCYNATMLEIEPACRQAGIQRS